jgi:hypothetical protein
VLKRFAAYAAIAAVLAGALGQAACAAKAQARTAKNNDPRGTVTLSPAEDAALRKVEDEFRVAKVKSDTAALAHVVADEYYGLNENGNARDKARLLELYKTFKMKSLDVDIKRIRVSGDRAVVAGRQVQDGPGPRETCVFLRTYVYRDGRWQLVTNAHYADPNKGGPADNTWANDVW